MSLATLLIATLSLGTPYQAAQTKPTAPVVRTVQVRPAGLSVDVPKAWKTAKKSSNIIESFVIPVEGSKELGRLDVAYLLLDNNDAEGYLTAQKDISSRNGFEIQKSLTLDVMSAPLAVVQTLKDGVVTKKGVLFRTGESKLQITVSAPATIFEKVDPWFDSTLTTLREIPVVAPKETKPIVERVVDIKARTVVQKVATPIKIDASVNGNSMVVKFPAKTKVKRLDEMTMEVVVPGLSAPVTLKCFSQRTSKLDDVYMDALKTSLSMFEGGMNRIESGDGIRYQDGFARIYVWRDGLTKSQKPLLSCDGFLVNPQDQPFLKIAYMSEKVETAKQQRKILEAFLTNVKLESKQ